MIKMYITTISQSGLLLSRGAKASLVYYEILLAGVPKEPQSDSGEGHIAVECLADTHEKHPAREITICKV
jgi:hypothetical protein